MFNEFLATHEKLKNANVEDPLLETLRFFDIRSDGALGRAGLCQDGQTKIDIETVVRKRELGIPIEHILGKACFMGRSFRCSPDTFLPTEQSGLLIEAARTLLQERASAEKGPLVLDIGTGCGNLAITLALTSASVRVFASDISPAAIEIARTNVSRYGLDHRVFLLAGDLLSPFQEGGYEGTIDMILCNPPYIPTRSIGKLPRELAEHGPRVAFDGGPFGIDLYRRLIKEAPALLKPGGILLFEIGEMQERLITRILEDQGGYGDIVFYNHGEKVRAMSARKKQGSV